MAKPKLITHSHASVDGRLTVAPDVLLLYGDPRWSAVAGADEDVYGWLQRTFHPQAFLEGSGSFMLEGAPVDPLPPVAGECAGLYDDYLPAEVVDVPGRKWLVVVDSRGRGRWLYKEFPGEDWLGWHILILVSAGTPAEYLAYLRRESIPYLAAGSDRVNLAAALDKLNTRLGVDTVVSTAGGKLSGALLRAGLVDEVSITFFPALIGGTATPTLFDSPELAAGELPARLSLLSSEVLPGGSVRLHYAVGGAA